MSKNIIKNVKKYFNKISKIYFKKLSRKILHDKK